MDVGLEPLLEGGDLACPDVCLQLVPVCRNEPSRAFLSRMGPSQALWVHLKPHGSIQNIMGPSKALWIRPKPHGSIKNLMGPFKALWAWDGDLLVDIRLEPLLEGRELAFPDVCLQRWHLLLLHTYNEFTKMSHIERIYLNVTHRTNLSKCHI